MLFHGDSIAVMDIVDECFLVHRTAGRCAVHHTGDGTPVVHTEHADASPQDFSHITHATSARGYRGSP